MYNAFAYVVLTVLERQTDCALRLFISQAPFNAMVKIFMFIEAFDQRCICFWDIELTGRKQKFSFVTRERVFMFEFDPLKLYTADRERIL